MIRDMIAVGLGGMVGSILRFAVASLLLAGCSPWGTFTVNAAGSLAIGLLMTLVPQGGWYWFAVTGLCGGFTTFSTFSADAVRLLHDGEPASAAMYIAASVIVCLLFTAAGMWIGNRINALT